MKIKTRNKIIALSLFLLFFSFSNTAKAATTLADIEASLTSTVAFISRNIIGPIKNDFCRNYILSISNGDWTADEVRTKLGRKICTGYSVPAGTEKIETASVQDVPSNTYIPSVDEILANLKENVFTPTNTSFDFSSGVGGSLNNKEIISLTNTERKNNSGLIALEEDSLLDRLASERVADMFSKQYFEHISPSGDNISKLAKREGYDYISIGENIAVGNFGNSAGVVKAWMDSPGHKANILSDKYTEIGVYASQGTYQGKSVWMAAQIFGRPLGDCKEPDATIKVNVEKYKISASSLLESINKIESEMSALKDSDVDAYNEKAAEYNTYAKLYNNLVSEIKKLTAEYNSQAEVFNACIKSI